MQDLGRQQEAHETVVARRLVVARHERAHPPLEVVRGNAVEREHFRANERLPPGRGNDEEPVAELVEVEREEVQDAVVRRVEREDARVAVTLAEQAAEPHQLDQQLIGREAISASRELVRRCLEGRLRRRMERIRVSGPDSLHQQAHVVGCRSRRGTSRTARPGRDDHCRGKNGKHDAPHGGDFSSTKTDVPRLKP